MGNACYLAPFRELTCEKKTLRQEELQQTEQASITTMVSQSKATTKPGLSPHNQKVAASTGGPDSKLVVGLCATANAYFCLSMWLRAVTTCPGCNPDCDQIPQRSANRELTDSKLEQWRQMKAIEAVWTVKFAKI